MCGIVGYVGGREASPVLCEGLRRLEYRGYDSAGLAVARDGGIEVLRSVGKLCNLEDLAGRRPLRGSAGLGHTRWATHGPPSEINSHPHTDCGGRVAVVHNGIIENYATLKCALERRGHAFRSETDTEVVAHLIEEGLPRPGENGLHAGEREALLLDAIRRALGGVRGAYALGILWSELPGTLFAAKSASPLVIGLGEGEAFVASDSPAFLDYTRRVVFLEDGELAMLGAGGCSFYGSGGGRVDKAPVEISSDRAVARKGGYRHFMLKEIHEQPESVANALRGRLGPVDDGLLERETGLDAEALAAVRSVYLVACGTAFHAGLVGRYLLERHARLQAQAEIASEFRYRQPVLGPGTLVVAISQSGETADTLAAVRLAKESGARVLSVCNTVGSALTRSADFNFYTRCGPECGVASTKAFTGQLAALALLTLYLGAAKGAFTPAEARAWAEELAALPELLGEALGQGAQVQEIARRYGRAEHFLYLGRGYNYPTALEGALKLKEISYIHAEGYGAGEMKHGPIALIDPSMPVVAVATESEVFDKMLSNMEEARARGGRLIALCSRGEDRLAGKAADLLEVPRASERLSPIVNAVPLQLLAYHAADLRGCDVDQPRNLAKSVTVE